MMDDDQPQRPCEIDEYNENDVLFGQGGHTISHAGSKLWRQDIRNRVAEHRLCTRTGKVKLCREIVQRVLLKGGRFLRKNAKGTWDVVATKKAEKKAAQRFRDERSRLSSASIICSDRGTLRNRRWSAGSGNPSTKQPKEHLLQPQFKLVDRFPAGIHVSIPNHQGRNRRRRLLNRDIDATLNRLKNQCNREVKPTFERIHSSTSHSPVAKSQRPQQLRDIKRLNDNDILFGRGAHCSYHEGNKPWRELIKDAMTEYCLKKRSERKEFSLSLIKQVRANGGRFLLKNDDGKWNDIGDGEAGKRTMQRFRDQHKEDAKFSKQTQPNQIMGEAITAESRFAKGHNKTFLARNHAFGTSSLFDKTEEGFNIFHGKSPLKSDTISPCQHASLSFDTGTICSSTFSLGSVCSSASDLNKAVLPSTNFSGTINKCFSMSSCQPTLGDTMSQYFPPTEVLMSTFV